MSTEQMVRCLPVYSLDVATNMTKTISDPKATTTSEASTCCMKSMTGTSNATASLSTTSLSELHQKGAKDDSQKPRMGLVLGGFSNALRAVADVGTFGAKKYTDNGWQSVPNGTGRYQDALLRHIFAHLSGQPIDEETNLAHLAHAAWNSLAILELEIKQNKGNK